MAERQQDTLGSYPNRDPSDDGDTLVFDQGSDGPQMVGSCSDDQGRP